MGFNLSLSLADWMLRDYYILCLNDTRNTISWFYFLIYMLINKTSSVLNTITVSKIDQYVGKLTVHEMYLEDDGTTKSATRHRKFASARKLNHP